MVPVVAIVRGTRKAVDRLDDATTDHEDPTAQAAFEERRGQKRIVQKAPGILANIFKRIFGGKKSTQPAGKVQEGDTAPPAVPLSAAQQPAVAAA